jgi:hypothetical protein
LRALADLGSITKIITVGAGNGTFADEERQLLTGFRLKEGFEQRGHQEEDQISNLLSVSSYGLSAQDELSLTKSSVIMAYAAHGLNVVNAAAGQDKTEPNCLFISPDELLGGLSETELAARAQRLKAWQENTSSWQLIANAFAAVLWPDR